ncbi:MFS transporter [Brevibacillus marinus]|uniref:MFS transporter n=1 Tax=Brevibacillus marinus TaxID=2496837 RepID=UPI000F835E46|nr:MFS transporter [Brevibacillus marinus]
MNTPDKPALWTKDFVLLAVSNLFLFLSFQMLIPTLPLYVTASGGDQFAVGLVIGVFTISALLIRPVTGKGLDTIGRQRLLVGGLLVFILSVAGYYWMTSVALVLLVRFIHGIGWGMATTAYGTIASDLIPAARRGEGMGYFGLSGNLAMAVGPLIGLWLLEYSGFGPLFLVSTCLGTLALILSKTLQIQEHVPPAAQRGAQPQKESFWQGLVERQALFPSLLVALFGMTYGGIISFITLFGAEAGIADVGWFFLVNAVFLMLVRPVAGILFDRQGPVWVLLAGGVLSALGLLILSYSTTPLTLIAAAVFYGAGFGTVQPSLMAWTINRVPPNRRGAANGTFFSAFDLGIGAGAMLLGAVAKAVGFAGMYRFSVLVMLVYLALYIGYLWIQRKAARKAKERRHISASASGDGL